MTATLDALESNGWVRRIANPKDRRSSLIEITPEGQGVIDRLLPGMRVLEKALLAGLSGAEKAALRELLAKVLSGAAAVVEAEPIPLDGRRNRPKSD